LGTRDLFLIAGVLILGGGVFSGDRSMNGMHTMISHMVTTTNSEVNHWNGLFCQY